MAEGSEGARTALIVGAGGGLSASLARACAADGLRVALAARDTGKLTALAGETGARAHACDASRAADVERLFADLDGAGADLDLVVFNASRRVRGPVEELDPEAVDAAVRTTAFAGFLVAQQAARRMLARGAGTIAFTGASASVKGYPNSSTFAMGKFALRGLAQSMARELAPRNVHVAHFVIDGSIARRTGADGESDDRTLDPDAIARTYLDVHHQHRSAWTWEVELRPWVERF